MLHFYVLYACVHVMAGKHAHAPGKHADQTGKTQCVESRVFFAADDCKRQVPKKHGGLLQKTKQARSWFECQEVHADTWIPADPTDHVSRLYEAAARASDESALAALLSPLSPQARATLAPSDLKSPFQRTFQSSGGPGSLSFFLLGTGSSVVVFAVSNLDDFQFADLAADVSSAGAEMNADQSKDLDFPGMAEDAGVQLSYHTVISHRDMPPPGGMSPEP